MQLAESGVCLKVKCSGNCDGQRRSYCLLPNPYDQQSMRCDSDSICHDLLASYNVTIYVLFNVAIFVRPGRFVKLEGTVKSGFWGGGCNTAT